MREFNLKIRHILTPACVSFNNKNQDMCVILRNKLVVIVCDKLCERVCNTKKCVCNACVCACVKILKWCCNKVCVRLCTYVYFTC